MAVCMVEAYLPVNEMDIKLHSLIHLAAKILNTGPLWVTSMFPCEGIWAKLVNWITNRAAPEVTLSRSFSDFEAAFHAYLQAPKEFCIPALKQFTEEFMHDNSAKYNIPRDPRTDAASLESTGFKGPSAAHPTEVKVKLAVHQYYMDFITE